MGLKHITKSNKGIMAKKIVKKKVGRPKGSKNKVSTECVKPKRGRPKKVLTESPIKRKRGRPRKDVTIVKSKTKPSGESGESGESTECSKSTSTECSKGSSTRSSTEKKYPRRRGRPSKQDQMDDIDTSNVKTYKLLGYCPDCHGMIGSGDMEEGKKMIYVCYKCHGRGRVNSLESDIPETPKPKSKKEFLSQTISSNEDHAKYKDEIPNEFNGIVAQPDWE